LASLWQRAALLAAVGRVDFTVTAKDASSTFELVPTRGTSVFVLASGDHSVKIDTAPYRGEITEANRFLPGFTVIVETRAVALATSSLAEAIAAARGLAGLFGRVYGARVRRIDLAADFEDWPLLESDAGCFVKPSRARDTAYLAAVEVFHDGQRLTGFMVGRGGLVARIYDKTVQLESMSSEKRMLEEALWRKGGWNSGPVTRVEFQLQSRPLSELGLRDPERLGDALDATWKYCTERWLRLVVAGARSRLKRAPLDRRWQAAQAVVFHHPNSPASRRERLPGGIRAEQAVGVVLSALARDGRLSSLASLVDENEVRAANDLPDEFWREWGDMIVDALGAELTELMRATILRAGRHGVEAICARVRARLARDFSSISRHGSVGKPPASGGATAQKPPENSGSNEGSS